MYVHLSVEVMDVCIEVKAQNCYTIEGFCYSNGNTIRSMFILSS